MNLDKGPLGLTFLNEEFLRSSEARQLRMLAELTAPGQRFAKEEIKNTVVFFGSARSDSLEDATAKYEALEERNSLADPVSNENLQELEQARMAVKLAGYYEAARELARQLTQWSSLIEPKSKRFVITSGGGPGLMVAANRGAFEAGGPSIGLNISLPFEQTPNPYQTNQLSFEFHYFFIRKFWFAYLAKGLVVFPGGFGTMDELFELLTLIQTGKIQKKIPIVLYGKEFWQDFLNFDALLKWQVISQKDLDLFTLVDDVGEAFSLITQSLEAEYL